MASDRYRKKPLVIEARRFICGRDEDGDVDNSGNGVALADWCGGKVVGHLTAAADGDSDAAYTVEIGTLEGTMEATDGDWIIKGVQNEFYPCKPSIFEETYEGFEDLTEPDDSITEHCATCGRGYMLWHSPDPLWQELIGHYGGTRCPRCFDELATERGITLVWTPVVMARGHFSEPTTNWWGDPIRDRLLMGEPDPHYHDNKRAQVPQGHWGEIAQALGWPYETPYPDENREDTMPGVVYRDSGVNAEAKAARG
jgi:DNA-directed RNA polymerase subunit RPC12/RpoP